MSSPLENLHKEFTNAINAQTYLSLKKNAPSKLVSTKEKTIRLADVFNTAQKEIKDCLNGKQLTNREIFQIKALLKDGVNMYMRYEKSTKTWERFFLKSLARYTPNFLKKILPTCFSNDIEKVEEETHQAYQAYSVALQGILPNHSHFEAIESESEDEEDIFEQDDNDDDDIQLQRILAASLLTTSNAVKNIQTPQTLTASQTSQPSAFFQLISEKIDIHRQKKSTALPPTLTLNTQNFLLKTIQKNLHALNKFEVRPLALNTFKKTLTTLNRTINVLTEMGPEAQNALKAMNFDEHIIATLKDIKLKGALLTGNHEQIALLLDVTPWKASFEETLSQSGYITIAMQTFGSTSFLKIVNESGKNVREEAIKAYRGQIKVANFNALPLAELEELIKLMKKNPSLRSNTLCIEIQSHQPLTSAFAKNLLILKDTIAHIEIKGMNTLDFNALALTQAEEIDFMHSFSFPDLKDVIFSDQAEHWTAADFSQLLTLCPTLEVLQKCYQQCSSYQDILFPDSLAIIQELDVRHFQLDHLTHLLLQFPHVTTINFSGLDLDDEQLIDVLVNADLLHINALNLEGCHKLTTDILIFLADLPNLRQISLPDLPEGTVPVNELPKFDNPFKIKLLYTTSKVTQAIATSLYTGPHIWSAPFQIPLSRMGIKEVFSSQQKIISPKNVAYWLHDNDYRHLTAQESIQTILADSNAKLNDDNIVEFMQKFPKAKSLSLYHCPNVTAKGMINLLKNCPQIKRLDLTGCLHITDDLLLGEGHLEYLKKLDKLFVTGTSTSSANIEAFKKKGVKIIFENALLKFTNDDLKDDQAIEVMLKGMDLTQIKYIDLEGCRHLTNKMFSQLLDRFNAPTQIQNLDGSYAKNPQRLNAACINIKGCKKITEEAFHLLSNGDNDDNKENQVGKKIDLKILESLDRMVTGGTDISENLYDFYPHITFQENDEPITIQIDLDRQLADCLAYHVKKHRTSIGKNEGKQFKQLGENYLHNRTAVELFHQDQEAAKKVLREPVDMNSNDFCDMTLYFMEKEPSLIPTITPTICHVHRDVLASQSRYFLDELRAEGTINKKQELDILNIHATPEATQAIRDLFYGNLKINDLDWKTAADVAEIIGPQNFKLPFTHYKQLLKRIHDQFDLSNADELLLIAEKLNDNEGKAEYEQTLLQILRALDDSSHKHFQEIGNLAKSHGLEQLKNEVEKMELVKSKKLIKRQLNEQRKLEEALVLAAIW